MERRSIYLSRRHVGYDEQFTSQGFTLVDSVDECDAVVFVGNTPVSARLAGTRGYMPSWDLGDPSTDIEDVKLLIEAKKIRKPIIGFSRGFSLLAMAAGETLVQKVRALNAIRSIELNGKEIFRVGHTKRQVFNIDDSSSSVVICRSPASRGELHFTEGDAYRESDFFRKGVPEVVLWTDRDFLGFAFDPINFPDQLLLVIDSFISRNYNDIVSLCTAKPPKVKEVVPEGPFGSEPEAPLPNPLDAGSTFFNTTWASIPFNAGTSGHTTWISAEDVFRTDPPEPSQF